MKRRAWLLIPTLLSAVLACAQFANAQQLAPPAFGPQALGVVLAAKPIVDLAAAWRCQNWVDRGGHGSCVHASTTMALHHAGYHNEARAWRLSHEGACTTPLLERYLLDAGIPFRSTNRGDVRFLESALADRRPCVIWWEGAAHCVLLVHLDATRAAICDPNCAHHQHWLSREEFLREWNHRDCRYALMILPPPPPCPHRRLPNARFSVFLHSPVSVRLH